MKYGHVPPKQIRHLQPWEEEAVDMIGPWRITINNFEYQFRALTCIDTIIGLPEVIPLDNATSSSVAIAFEDNWLSRYPAQLRYLHDNGNEFLGPSFSSMLFKNKIKSVPTTVKNPQENAIVERMHQSISTMIAISQRENPPLKYEDVSNLVLRKYMAAQYAIRATINMTLKHTPGELAFGRDMILPIPSKVNWEYLFQNKQNVISQTNVKENLSRKQFNYKVGQRILILNKNQQKVKLEPTVLNEGPWPITQIHTNGTVTILRNNYVERINIPRICPFFE